MLEVTRLTESNLHWFQSILTPTWMEKLYHDANTTALGAVRDGAACGVLIFHEIGPVADIVYLTVSDSYRRQGIATALVQFLCRYANQSVTPVTCTFLAEDDDDPMLNLFRDLPTFTVTEEDGYCCTISFAQLRKPNRLSHLCGLAQNVRPFFSLPALVQRNFRTHLAAAGVPYLREMSTDPKDYAAELCLCCLTQDSVDAALFVEPAEDGLYLSLAWCLPGKQRSLMGLLAQACGRVTADDSQGNLHLAAVTPAVTSIAEKLFPDRTITGRFYQAVWDMVVE